MRILEQTTDLGKCVICSQRVSTDDSVWFNEASVTYKEKIICGVCLVNLNGASNEAMGKFDASEDMPVRSNVFYFYEARPTHVVLAIKAAQAITNWLLAAQAAPDSKSRIVVGTTRE